ncbi:MAG: hypothetical protein N2746_05185 [Deltaproteobacteria bacterium]|nr:hypothetical protein [Deltaproteobacteria bacterium]
MQIEDFVDASIDDILDVEEVLDVNNLGDAHQDILKCESGVVGIYGPYNKIEVSLPAELYPFPNDYYVRVDSTSPTNIRLNYPGDVFLNGINELVGFPTYPFLISRFVVQSKPEGRYKVIPIVNSRYNKISFDEDSVFLLPLDALFEHKDKRQIEKHLVPLEMHSSDNGSLFVLVREILSEEREYLFFITERLKVRVIDTDDNSLGSEECVSTTQNFEAVKSRRSVESRYPGLEEYRKSLEPIFDELEEKINISRKNIIMFSKFRTGKNVSILREIKKSIDDMTDFNPEIIDVFKPIDEGGRLTDKMKGYLPCAADIKSVDEFYDYDFSNVDSVIIGYYNSPNYLDERNRLNFDPIKRTYESVKTNRVQFIIILPKNNFIRGIIPPFPLVIFQHAFEVCKETSLALAGTFTSFGFAIGAIDMIGHGVRSGKLRCEDGRVYCDTPSLDFIKVDDMLTTVNWLRQSAIDTIAFYKMLKGLKIDVVPSISDVNGSVIVNKSGDGIDDFDSERLLFTSQSLGSFLGISIVSLVGDFKASVFNVPAAAFYKLLSVELSENGDIWELKDMYLPFIVSIQTLVDEIEVLNFSRLYNRENGVNINVLIQAAKNDEVVPHNGTEMLGYFMKLEQVDALRVIEDVPQVTSPHSGSYHSEKISAAYYQFYPAEHIFYLKSVNKGVRESAQYQSATFLRSSLSRKYEGGLIIDPFSCSQVSEFVNEAKGYPLEVYPNPFCK